MLRTVRNDLEALSDTLEHIAKTITRLDQQEKVDLCARVNALKNATEALEKALKEEFKTSLKHKPGFLFGENFKAKLSLIAMPRLDQQKLRGKYPTAYFACVNTDDEERITFSPR